MVAWFIKGGVFMWPILGTLIIGTIIVLGKLFMVMTQRTKAGLLMQNVKKALAAGDDAAAMKLCAGNKPVESVIYAGLKNKKYGLEAAEKGLTNEGSVQATYLDNGQVWITLMISLAPMLGFLGTVWGMVDAMDAIAAANDISPSVVASGISEALITTAAGLIIAIGLQTLQNVVLAFSDGIVQNMEESSVALMEMLTENAHK